MTISYIVTEERRFKFEPKDIVALAIESRHKSELSTDPGEVYDDIRDNIDLYLESLGLPNDAYDGDGVPYRIADKIMEEVDKYIDWDSEEL